MAVPEAAIMGGNRSWMVLFVAVVTSLVFITGSSSENSDDLTRATGRNLLAIPSYSAYHGVTGAVHQTNFNKLVSQGYRIITLSVYGDRADPRYAAVWVLRSGPPWSAIHGATAAQFQARFNQLSAQGYVPLIISATGPVTDPIFAGTFEKRSVSGWITRFGLKDGADTDPASFQGLNYWAVKNNFILRVASIYGTSATSRVYAAIWEPNPRITHWIVEPHDTASGYQTWFDAYTQLPFRPSFVTLSSSQEYLSLFTDDTIGPWIARHGLTSAQYQSQFDTHTKNGYYPISVQGGGAGAATRYAVIFAKQETPNPRIWTVTGPTPPTKLQPFDTIIRNFMQAHGVRAGQLSLAKDGVIKFARAYTYAEPGYFITQPNSLMRLASVSKAFTLAAIKKSFDLNLVTPSTLVFPLLGITKKAIPSQTVSPHINKITVQHLIDHSGGWNARESNFDPVFGLRKIYSDLKAANYPGLTISVSKYDMAAYMFGEPLQYIPGTQTFESTNGATYSNFGYVLLGLVVEKVNSGQLFRNFLREKVLLPLGISEVYVGGDLRSQRRSNEVFYDQPAVGLSAIDPSSQTLVPYAYGGEGYTCVSMDSGGGLVSSATDVVRFIAKNAVWGVGGRTLAGRSGSMAGVSSFAGSRADGVDGAVIFNTRDFPPYNNSHNPIDELVDEIVKQLDTEPL